jgi:uncharacterized membrane protein YqjE
MTIDTQSQRGEHSPLRRIIGSVFAILQTRLELVGIELAEEKDRLLGVLFLGLAAMMLATMALIALTALIAIAFWDTYRWQALAGITAVYAIAGLACASSKKTATCSANRDPADATACPASALENLARFAAPFYRPTFTAADTP